MRNVSNIKRHKQYTQSQAFSSTETLLLNEIWREVSRGPADLSSVRDAIWLWLVVHP